MVVGSFVCVGTFGVVGISGAAADDQTQIDEAMAALNTRLTDAGWTSQGPQDAALGGEDEAMEDEESSMSDDQFEECLGELSTVFDSSDETFPGETARSYSDEFVFELPSAGPDTTDVFSFELDEEETVAGFALSVDEANVPTLSSFVELIGSEATGECLQAALEAEMATETESSDGVDIPFQLDFEVTTDADLGVGDESASFAFSISGLMMGIPIDVNAEVVLARVGRHLVTLAYSTAAGAQNSGIDLVAELQSVADGLR